MMGLEHIAQGMIQAGQGLSAAANTLYELDAERKYFDWQVEYADQVDQFMLSLETDPDYGTPKFASSEEYARINGIDTSTREGYEKALHGWVASTDPNSGYMKRWNEQVQEARKRVDAIENPLARKMAERELGKSAQQFGAQVQLAQVNAWKKDLVASSSKEIDRLANSGGDFNTTMPMIQQQIDLMSRANAITPEQAEALNQAGAQGLLRSQMVNGAYAKIKEQGEAGFLAARQAITEMSANYTIGGKTYTISDDTRNSALELLNAYNATDQAKRDEEMQRIWQRGGFDPSKNGLTKEIIDSSGLEEALKWKWYQRMNAEAALMGRAGGKLESADAILATVQRLHLEKGYSITSLKQGFMNNPEYQALPNDIYMEVIKGFDAAAVKKFSPIIRTKLDQWENIADGFLKTEMKNLPESVRQQFRAYVLGATLDLLYETPTGSLSDAELDKRIGGMIDQAAAIAIDGVKPNSGLGFVIRGPNGQATNDSVVKAIDLLANGRDMVYLDDMGADAWVSPEYQAQYKQLAEWGTDRFNDYNIAVEGQPRLEADGLYDASPVPVWRGKNGNDYKYVSINGRPELMQRAKGSQEWAQMPNPEVAAQNAARTKDAQARQAAANRSGVQYAGNESMKADLPYPAEGAPQPKDKWELMSLDDQIGYYAGLPEPRTFSPATEGPNKGVPWKKLEARARAAWLQEFWAQKNNATGGRWK